MSLTVDSLAADSSYVLAPVRWLILRQLVILADLEACVEVWSNSGSKEANCSKKMSGYKLYYFNVRAKGEICRFAFAAANIEFEDIRLQGEEWTKEKACKFKYKL